MLSANQVVKRCKTKNMQESLDTGGSATASGVEAFLRKEVIQWHVVRLSR
jgi:hypothetical protein